MERRGKDFQGKEGNRRGVRRRGRIRGTRAGRGKTSAPNRVSGAPYLAQRVHFVEEHDSRLVAHSHVFQRAVHGWKRREGGREGKRRGGREGYLRILGPLLALTSYQ
jgi:hypothetical protein